MNRHFPSAKGLPSCTASDIHIALHINLCAEAVIGRVIGEIGLPDPVPQLLPNFKQFDRTGVKRLLLDDADILLRDAAVCLDEIGIGLFRDVILSPEFAVDKEDAGRHALCQKRPAGGQRLIQPVADAGKLRVIAAVAEHEAVKAFDRPAAGFRRDRAGKQIAGEF